MRRMMKKCGICSMCMHTHGPRAGVPLTPRRLRYGSLKLVKKLLNCSWAHRSVNLQCWLEMPLTKASSPISSHKAPTVALKVRARSVQHVSLWEGMQLGATKRRLICTRMNSKSLSCPKRNGMSVKRSAWRSLCFHPRTRADILKAITTAIIKAVECRLISVESQRTSRW